MTFGIVHGAQRSKLPLKIGVLAVTLIGAAIRMFAIDRWPLWGDEALTPLIAQWPVRILFLAPVDPTPGLYYGLHKLFLGPMVGAAAARSISLACGILLIPTAYFLAREARVPALLGAALIALSFPLIDYSQEARAYSLLVLLVTLSAAVFIRWVKLREPAALFAALFLCLLAFYTHFASVFWIGPIVVAIVCIGGTQAIRPLLLTAVLAVPELLRIAHYPDDGFVWLAQATPLQLADTLANALLPFGPSAGWLLLLALVAAWRGWIHRAEIAGWGRMNPGAAIAIGILAAAPFVIWLFGLAVRPVFMTRTMLIGVPGILMAVALLLKFEGRILRFLVVSAYALSLLVTGTTRQKEDWRSIAQRVGHQTILMCQPWQVAAMRHASIANGRTLLSANNGLGELIGPQWPIAFDDSMPVSRPTAHVRLAHGVDPNMYPVWPIRSGNIADLPERPVTLGQAMEICERDLPAIRRPSYRLN